MRASVYRKDGTLIAIEGDSELPISRGHLCPEGADTFELHTHPGRHKKITDRRPYSREREHIDLEQAMDTAADRRSRFRPMRSVSPINLRSFVSLRRCAEAPAADFNSEFIRS